MRSAGKNGLRLEWHLPNAHRMTLRANDFPRSGPRLHQQFVGFRSSLHSAWLDAAGSSSYVSLRDKRQQHIELSIRVWMDRVALSRPECVYGSRGQVCTRIYPASKERARPAMYRPAAPLSQSSVE